MKNVEKFSPTKTYKGNRESVIEGYKEINNNLMKTVKLKDLIFKEKFTFEDWANGNIPPLMNDLKRLEYFKNWPTMKTDEYVTDLIEYYIPDLNDSEEFLKVKKEKRRIYHLAKKMAIDNRFSRFIQDIRDLNNVEQEYILQEEIDHCNEKLSHDLIRQVTRKKDSSLTQITPLVRQKILDYKKAYDEGEREFKDPNFSGENNTYADIEFIKLDNLFDAHVNWGYMIKLRDIEKKGLDTYLTTNNDKKEKPSGSAKLHIASDWMDPLAREIGGLEIPVKDEDIISCLEKWYPNFRNEFNWDLLKSPLSKGEFFNKTSVSIALHFIFTKKHPGVTFEPDSIRTRYTQRYDYWPVRK